MAKNYPWTDYGFDRGARIDGGNQGHTYLARRLTDPEGEFAYVLKVLKRQREVSRRALFRNEVVALESLDHKGIAKLVVTNAEEYRQVDSDLFLITEHISGTGLDHLVDSNKLSFEDAIRMTINVLDILALCHERGVVHRDIKPCHVILRNNSPDDPVLIDFGIAYNYEAQLSEAETQTGEGRGNRFFIGPEHLAGNPAVNRNPITDICGCVGLLFFALTGQWPRILMDTDSKKPHQKLARELSAIQIPDWKRNRLSHVFDVGFEWEPSRRWQSIERLAQRLTQLLSESEPTGADFDAELVRIVRLAEASSHTVRMGEARKMAESLAEVVKSAVDQIKLRTEKTLNVRFSGGAHNSNPVGTWVIGLENKIDRSSSRTVQFVVNLTANSQIEVFFKSYSGNLAVFKRTENGLGRYDLGNFDLGNAECDDVVRPLVNFFLTQCLAEVLGVDTS